MAGLEVEEVHDPVAVLAPFTVAKIISTARHPDADRLQVCQVETVDGLKEIVCGAPNARPGLNTIYAPIGAYVPGLGVTLVEKPVRGVVSHGMLCSASELELADESDGIQELPPEIPPRLAGRGRHRPRPGRRQRRQAEAFRHRRGARRLPLADLGAAGCARDVPGLRRSRHSGREERSVAGLAAEASDRHRPAPDQSSGRCHQPDRL